MRRIYPPNHKPQHTQPLADNLQNHLLAAIYNRTVSTFVRTWLH